MRLSQGISLEGGIRNANFQHIGRLSPSRDKHNERRHVRRSRAVPLFANFAWDSGDGVRGAGGERSSPVSGRWDVRLLSLGIFED